MRHGAVDLLLELVPVSLSVVPQYWQQVLGTKHMLGRNHALKHAVDYS